MPDFSAEFDRQTHISLYHLDNMNEAYTGESYSTDQTAAITAATTEINSRFDGFLEAHPEFDAGMIAEVEGLRDYALAAVNDNIPTEVEAPYSDIFTQVKEDLQTAITAVKDDVCKRCAVGGVGVGRYPETQDDPIGGSEDKMVHCAQCDGFGGSEEPEHVTPNIDWQPITRTYTT